MNYGQAIKDYLLKEVTLLQIHRFDPAELQFENALVSSAIVWFKNSKPKKNHKIKFSYGGTLTAPVIEKEIPAEVLRNETKWSRFPVSGARIKKLSLIHI